nr:transposase, MuDR, MULE transposase domain protein [Tanacetum cinerariifolium]
MSRRDTEIHTETLTDKLMYTDIDDETLNGSGYGDIATMHFIWEGEDTFYVTGYDEHGSEIDGYNDLMTQQRRSKILVTLGNDPGESPIFSVDARSFLFGISFNKYMHKDPRVRHICNWKGHFVVHEDEEDVFYQTLSRHVKNKGSLAIPPDFVTTNDLFIFEHAKIVYGKKSYRLEFHQEFYSDDTSHTCCQNLWTRSSHKSCVPYVLSRSTVVVKLICIKWIVHRIPGKSLDKELVPLISNQDVLSLLQYVPIYKEIKVYIEKNTMEVVLGTGKGVVIEEVMEDDEVKEASETGNSDDLLQKEDLVNYQQGPHHGEDEAKENAELFNDQDHLLEHVPFLKETVIIVDGDALLLVVDALVVTPVIVLDEQLERPNKRRKLNPT